MALHPSVTVFHDSIHQFANLDFELEVLNDDCLFSEGPVWNGEGYYLFSDIPSNDICKIIPGEAKEVFLQKSGCNNPEEAELPRMMGSNGLSYNTKGDLLVCQHGNHAIALYDGTFLKPFVTTYEGKLLNSPNDIVAHPNGSVFFSDPPYGLKDQKPNPEKYQPVAGVYCWRDGDLKRVTDRYQYPNGLCLSPDGKSLFTCSNKPFEAIVLEWDAATLQLKREVCKEAGDGIKCDRFGNLYLNTNEGILMVNAQGQRLARIALPTVPANCCWGGPHLQDLFITARNFIFHIKGLQRA